MPRDLMDDLELDLEELPLPDPCFEPRPEQLLDHT